MKFTIDEEMLMNVYEISDRLQLIDAMRDSLPYISEHEMSEMLISALEKLEELEDLEFNKLNIYDNFDFDSEV
jgi:hypothetical protein